MLALWKKSYDKPRQHIKKKRHHFFDNGAMLCLVAQLCPTLCNPVDCSPSGSSVHGDSPGKNAEVGCHALLLGIFPTNRSNPGLPHCWHILYHLSHQGSPADKVKAMIFPVVMSGCESWTKRRLSTML